MKNKSIILLALIIIISLSGCGEQKSDKTIKLAFSKYDINEVFLFNNELEEYTNAYCEFYRNIIALYNHEILDEFNNSLDFYDEYELSFSMYDEMQSLIDNMELADSKKLAVSMQVNAAATNYLLAKLSANIQEETAEELYKNIVDNYEYICEGE